MLGVHFQLKMITADHYYLETKENTKYSTCSPHSTIVTQFSVTVIKLCPKAVWGGKDLANRVHSPSARKAKATNLKVGTEGETTAGLLLDLS